MNWHLPPLPGPLPTGPPPKPRDALQSVIPPTVRRLFTPHGAPPLTVADRVFFREVERQTGPLERAFAQLNAGLDHEDVVQLTIACRRFLAIGQALGDAAREAERGRV